MSLRRLSNRQHTLSEGTTREYWEDFFQKLFDSAEHQAKEDGGHVEWDSFEVNTEVDYIDSMTISGAGERVRIKTVTMSMLEVLDGPVDLKK